MNRYGIEVETAIPKNHNWEIGCYHHGYSIPNTTYWKAEEDGSINPTGDYEDVEMVSACFANPQLVTVLHELADSLDKVGHFEINRSCGCHLHFSASWFAPNQFPALEANAKLRRRAHRIVRKHAGARGLALFKEQYYRDYAEEMNGIHSLGQREKEFNTIGGKGVEWRSFNLEFVNVLKENKARIKLIVRVLKDVFQMLNRWLNGLARSTRVWAHRERIRVEVISEVREFAPRIARYALPVNAENKIAPQRVAMRITA